MFNERQPVLLIPILNREDAWEEAKSAWLCASVEIERGVRGRGTESERDRMRESRRRGRGGWGGEGV